MRKEQAIIDLEKGAFTEEVKKKKAKGREENAKRALEKRTREDMAKNKLEKKLEAQWKEDKAKKVLEKTSQEEMARTKMEEKEKLDALVQKGVEAVGKIVQILMKPEDEQKSTSESPFRE